MIPKEKTRLTITINKEINEKIKFLANYNKVTKSKLINALLYAILNNDKTYINKIKER